MKPWRLRTKEEQDAWDLFAACALSGAMPDGGQFGGVAERAAAEADKLLELRRERLEADRQAASKLEADARVSGDR